ncbi:phytochrome-like protein cph2 [Actinoplanes sp. NPDC051494]|uniref:phytochrome-like protein cph2 n=1 Tax=Actinoplanes sp. NPDC051494 TaxID=3363907 RepID=UPI0037AD81C4
MIDARAVTPVFRRLVSLRTGAPVGFEVSGPPGDLAAAARAVGRGAELAWVFRAAAYRTALDTGLDVTLLVAAERAPCPPELAAEVARAEKQLTIVEELATGRELALSRELAAGRELAGRGGGGGLLGAAAGIRAAGHGVALGDVAAGVALLPLVQPDVVTVDMGSLRSPEDPYRARTVAAVGEYAEAFGAAVVVTGVQSPEDARLAWAAGATVVREGVVREGVAPELTAGEKWPPRAVAPGIAGGTPYAIVGGCRPVMETSRASLVAVSRRLEALAADGQVLLACGPEAGDPGAAMVRRLGRIARLSPLVAVLGEGVDAEPAPGVRGVDLTEGDPLRGERNLIVLGPQQAAALVAREIDGDRFGFAVTYQRDLVVAAARSLLGRVS